ncbi:MAG: thymidine phosphorylase [Eubacteriales bacterium]|nr:thymidine phosphorylase [Eubacteriales bacterium]
MRMYDVIAKKKRGQTLSDEEIRFFVEGYVSGRIPDYQVSALLMAICFQGMDARETTTLTMAMAHSGDMADLSPIQGIKADKHSTGGVGDKTTLIVGPIVAACGVKVAKMSGRGLGFTGGTLDKLEAIPGFRTAVPVREFYQIVNEVGIALVGQTGNLVPADKKLYALRDVTATVDSMPLIASSIMSKKLAAGSDVILLDVKTGSGAFMKTIDGARELARAMVEIGNGAGRRCAALITDMDVPLGAAVGNALEVQEAIEVLRGGGPEDLRQICLELAAGMLALAQQTTGEDSGGGSRAGQSGENGTGSRTGQNDGDGGAALAACRERARRAIRDGSAFETFCRMVRAQGGDESYVREPSRFGTAPFCEDVFAPEDGYVTAMRAETIGIAGAALGAGRETKEDSIDPLAGVVLHRKYGDPVRAGERIATLYTSEQGRLTAARDLLLEAYTFGAQAPKPRTLVYESIGL